MIGEKQAERNKRLGRVRFPFREWLLSEDIVCLSFAEQAVLLRILIFLWTSNDEAIWDDETKIAALCGGAARGGEWTEVRAAVMPFLAPHPALPGFLTFGPKLEAFRCG